MNKYLKLLSLAGLATSSLWGCGGKSVGSETKNIAIYGGGRSVLYTMVQYVDDQNYFIRRGECPQADEKAMNESNCTLNLKFIEPIPVHEKLRKPLNDKKSELEKRIKDLTDIVKLEKGNLAQSSDPSTPTALSRNEKLLTNAQADLANTEASLNSLETFLMQVRSGYREMNHYDTTGTNENMKWAQALDALFQTNGLDFPVPLQQKYVYKYSGGTQSLKIESLNGSFGQVVSVVVLGDSYNYDFFGDCKVQQTGVLTCLSAENPGYNNGPAYTRYIDITNKAIKVYYSQKDGGYSYLYGRE